MSRRVMIATPAHDGTVCVEYAHSLYYTGRIAAAKGIEIFPVWLPRESLVQRARNQLVQIALSAKPEISDILFIDADQEWNPADVLKILAYPVDVVGAPVRKKTDTEESYNVKADGPNIPVDLKTGLLVVESVGTGFLRLSRLAIQALWNMSDLYSDLGTEHRAVFEPRVIEERFWSEDTMMCLKLRTVGFNIHVDPSINVAHVGAKKYTGDFAAWLARLKQQSAA